MAITQWHKDEIVRCARSFRYFAEKYLKAHRPEGTVPFRLYDHQERLAQTAEENRFVLSVKYRQGGFTEGVLAFFVWQCLFNLDQNILCLFRTDRTAWETGRVVKRWLEELPQFLQPDMSRNNDHNKYFDETNCKLWFHAPQAACGRAVNWLFIDEAAFISDMDQHWKAIYPTLACGGKAIIQSTPNGKYRNRKSREHDWFYDLVFLTRQGSQTFSLLEHDYRQHPDFTPERIEELKRNLGEKGFRQEILCEFSD